MAYSAERYELLTRLGGFTAKEANTFARRSDKNVAILIQDKILTRLENGEKFTEKAKYAISRFFGATSKEAGLMRKYGVESFYNSLIQHALPKVLDLAQDRILDIPLLSAYSAGRYQQKAYLYEVEYYVDTGFASTKKFVTVTSNKKLTKNQIHEFIIDTQFPKHEEEYESVPLPNTIKVVKAYYITANERKKILAKRDADINARKKTTHNKSRKG